MQTEITVEVLEDISSVKNKLLSNGFEILEEKVMKDYYFSKYSKQELLSFEYNELIKNSILVRNLICKDKTINQILYKEKIVDNNNNVIAEQKHKCNIENIEDVVNIFNLADLNCWCEIIQNMFIFSNGGMCFALQEAEGLGLFIEYEEDEDMKDLGEYEKIQILLNRLKNLGINLGQDYSCKKVLMKFKKDNENI